MWTVVVTPGKANMGERAEDMRRGHRRPGRTGHQQPTDTEQHDRKRHGQ